MDNWIKKDLRYIWHPYTQMKDCRTISRPILIEKANGIKLFDDSGNFYYDTISSWWCNVHGHNHPVIKKAISKQLKLLEHVLFAGFTHKPAISLAEKLITIGPGNLTKVFFSDNGSTAVEIALKISFQYWQNIGVKTKTKFLSLDHAYHGDTIGAMSVSGVDLFNNIFSPLFFESFKVISPYCYRCPVKKNRVSCDIECIKPLETMLRDKNSEIAAIILEPLVLAAGGMIIYPAEYLKRTAALAKRYNVHLILDEVATGFGRTGRMFACEHTDAKPDFICLSKGITAGFLPLAATLTTDAIYKAFYADYKKRKTFYHGHTYTANPISCSAAIASLEVFRKENVLKKIEGLIPLFNKRLQDFRDLAFVGDVRHIGMIGAIELVKDKAIKTAFGFNERIGLRVYAEALKEQLILRPLGNIIYFYLPLCIKKNELAHVLKKAYKVIKNLPNLI
jgi:adenosylmethionine-8-amino-7-oxononanoate aminotransferase